MPQPRPRAIKKPRISLSCIVCRRRKVRCGREQPECANCVRMKETCVYRPMVRDKSTGRVRQASPQDRQSSGSELRPQREAHPADHRHQRQHQHQPSRSPSYHGHSQLPNDTDTTSTPDHLFKSPEPNAGTFTTSTDPINPRPTALCRDYLSQRRGAHVRYIGPNFWGIVAGKERLSEDFFDENLHAPPDLPLPHISSIGMFNLLRSLPTKPVSDTLFESFFVAVWPLSPLIHPPTLQADYDQFWDWCRNNERALPPDKLRDDPTLICLLFAILYCGASAAPATSWALSNLQGLQKEKTVRDLKLAYTTSLALCQDQDHPTLNTLISSLLTRPFLDRSLDAMRNLVYVSTTVRIAQMMGLHRERVDSTFSPLDREFQRRIWWHIVWLDVQSSISTGLNLCCSNEAIELGGMLGFEDEELSSIPRGVSLSSDFVAGGQSVAKIYAIGRFQMARLQARIITHLQSPRGAAEEGFGELAADAKQLLQKINSLIALVSTPGISESGYISPRLANASPLTHPSLYKDDASQPTVFAAWTRIMFTLLKFELAILLRKPLLPPPDSTNSQSRSAWTSIVHLCVRYLRIYMQLYQTPAFAPYAWFCCGHYGPFQCLFITLMCLHSFPASGEFFLARYLVDEVIHHCVAHYEMPGPSSAAPTGNNSAEPESSGGKMRMPLAIQVLVEFHARLNSPDGLDDPDVLEGAYRFAGPHLVSKISSHMRAPSNQATSQTPPSTTNRTNRDCDTSPIVSDIPPTPSVGSKSGLRTGNFEAGSDSGRDMDFLSTVLDLEAWSSLMLLDSDDVLANDIPDSSA